MRFAETKIENGFKYWTVDDEVFGKITFMLPKQLPKKTASEHLDSLVSYCLKTQLKKGEVKLEVSKGRFIKVAFAFRKKPDWGDKEKVKIKLKK